MRCKVRAGPGNCRIPESACYGVRRAHRGSYAMNGPTSGCAGNSRGEHCDRLPTMCRCVGYQGVKHCIAGLAACGGLEATRTSISTPSHAITTAPCSEKCDKMENTSQGGSTQ